MAMPVVTAMLAATVAATRVREIVQVKKEPDLNQQQVQVKKEQSRNPQAQARAKVKLVPGTVPELARSLNQARKVKAAPLKKALLWKALKKAPTMKVTQAIPAKKKAIAREKAKANLTTQETLIIMAKMAKPVVHLKQ